MNLRTQGTVKELTEWIAYYQKEVNEGRFCPVRGAKTIAHFQELLEKKLQHRPEDEVAGAP